MSTDVPSWTWSVPEQIPGVGVQALKGIYDQDRCILPARRLAAPRRRAESNNSDARYQHSPEVLNL